MSRPLPLPARTPKSVRVARCGACGREVSQMKDRRNAHLWVHRSSGSKYCDDTGQTQVDPAKLVAVER